MCNPSNCEIKKNNADLSFSNAVNFLLVCNTSLQRANIPLKTLKHLHAKRLFNFLEKSDRKNQIQCSGLNGFQK